MRTFVLSRLYRILRADKWDILAFFMLLAPYIMGAIDKQSALISDHMPRQLTACDTRIHGLCIWTFYIPVKIGPEYLILNFTSLAIAFSIFVAGFLILRKRKMTKSIEGK